MLKQQLKRGHKTAIYVSFSFPADDPDAATQLNQDWKPVPSAHLCKSTTRR